MTRERCRHQRAETSTTIATMLIEQRQQMYPSAKFEAGRRNADSAGLETRRETFQERIDLNSYLIRNCKFVMNPPSQRSSPYGNQAQRQ